MIVTTPNTFNLTIGAPGRIPEESDAQVIVPGTIMPVAYSLRPHIGGFQSAVELNESSMIETSNSRTNQAATTIAFALLGKGLWELECTLATVYNYVGTVAAFNGVALQITYGGQIRNTIKRLSAIGSFVDRNNLKLLLLGQATLSLDLPLTGAGQSLDTVLMINCVRVL